MLYNQRWHTDEKLRRCLAQPENRVKYCYQWLDHSDYQMRNTALESALNYISQCNWEEAHY